MATPIDLTRYRLEAARNLGMIADFLRIHGRGFTGSRADYAMLSQQQQLELSAEMSRLLQADKALQLTQAQQTAAARLAAPPPPPGPSTLELFGQGALEGLVAIPKRVGGAVQQATGGTISGILTKTTVLAAVVIGGFFAWQSGLFRSRRR